MEESEHEADKTETKLKLMESVLGKLKTGTEDLYIKCDCGSTPVLSLLGDTKVKVVLALVKTEHRVYGPSYIFFMHNVYCTMYIHKRNAIVFPCL